MVSTPFTATVTWNGACTVALDDGSLFIAGGRITAPPDGTAWVDRDTGIVFRMLSTSWAKVRTINDHIIQCMCFIHRLVGRGYQICPSRESGWCADLWPTTPGSKRSWSLGDSRKWRETKTRGTSVINDNLVKGLHWVLVGQQVEIFSLWNLSICKRWSGLQSPISPFDL